MPETDTISCDVNDLATASKCYCYDEAQWRQVMVYLLAVTAGLDGLSPSELASRSACYCFTKDEWQKAMAYLLCQAVNA